jgi:iron complex transport system substrate-binding protein
MKHFPARIFFLLMAIGVVAFSTTSCFHDTTSDVSGSNTGDTLKRIVSLDGMVTELLYQLELGEQIVGIDVTSTYPEEELKGKPQLGHVSQLNAEAILALRPDLIICKKQDVNNPVLAQLISAGVNVFGITTTTHFNNAVEVARQLQTKLSISEASIGELTQNIALDSLRLANHLEKVASEPRILFLYARGTGRLFVSGSGTPVAAMLEKAGGRNAVTNFSDYKELSPEALLAANPEVLLLFESGLNSLEGMDGLGEIPGMAQTTAYQHKRVITMDGHYLSSFGPRAAQAAYDLALQLQTFSQTEL